MNISSRMQRYIGIVGVISLPIIIFFVRSGQNAQYQDQELLVHERTMRLAKDIDVLLANRLSALDYIGFAYNELSHGDLLIRSRFIQDFGASRDDIADIAVVDDRGREVIRKTADTKKTVALTDRSQNIEFLTVKEKGYYLGPVYLSMGKPMLLMGRIIPSADGKAMRGAVFILFRADVFLDVLKQAATQEGVMAFIVNKKGIVMLHPTLPYISEHKDISYNPSVQFAIAGNALHAPIYKNELTEKVVGGAVPLVISSNTHGQLETGWFVIMETPASIMFAAIARQRSFVGLGLFILWILAGAGLWIALRAMRSPVLAMDRALQEISDGNLMYRLDIPRSDEWKRVSIGVNNLADRLAHTFHDLIQERIMVLVERKKLMLALSEISDAMITCDGNGKIVLANKPAEELIGYPADVLVGKHIDKVVRLFENDTPLLASAYYSQAQVNGLVRMGNVDRLRLITAENHERLVSARIGALGIKESTRHDGYMVALHDVSRERFLEKVKADFVFIAANELRTPLTEVKWAMDILMGKEFGVLSRKQKGLIKRTFESNEHMIGLVDDLLKTATIESAQFHYNKAPQDIKKIVDDIIRMRKKVAKSKGIVLAFKKSKTRMPLISVDQAAIKIAVNNLLENAIAYTPKGGSVNVSMGRTDSTLEIHVVDTGIGIPQEDADMVFLKFFRGKDAARMTTGGAGLGLYIAKKIIEAHGGTIWVQSQPDKGSTFGVSLPV